MKGLRRRSHEVNTEYEIPGLASENTQLEQRREDGALSTELCSVGEEEYELCREYDVEDGAIEYERRWMSSELRKGGVRDDDK